MAHLVPSPRLCYNRSTRRLPLTRAKFYGFAGLSAFALFSLPLCRPLLFHAIDVEAYTRGTFSIEQTVDEAAEAHRVDPAVLKSVIKAESGFEIGAVSPKGAIGLMQLMPETAEEFGYDARDPEENVHAGAAYLSVLIRRYRHKRNGLQLAIAAYNAGPGNVERYRGVPPFRETRTYVKRVLGYYRDFKSEDRRQAAAEAGD